MRSHNLDGSTMKISDNTPARFDAPTGASTSVADLALLLGLGEDKLLTRLAANGGLEGLTEGRCAGFSEEQKSKIAAVLRLSPVIGTARGEALLARTPMISPAYVNAWASNAIGTLEHEELWMLCLDARHRLRRAVRLAIGSSQGVGIDLRAILRVALEHNARNVMLCHNHPSGDVTPSLDDKRMTQAAKKGFEAVGVNLLDHVIVGPTERWVSLFESDPDLFR